MASYGAQSDLVVQTVQDLNNLRTATYNLATNSLEDLKNAIVDLPLTVIDTDIGTALSINWSAIIPTAPTITEPTYPDLADISEVPIINAITQPAEVEIDTAPTWDVSLDTVPTVPTISLPEVDAISASWTAIVPATPTVVEPDYPALSGVSTIPTIDTITQPAEVVVSTAPTWTVSLDTAPTAPTITWPDAPNLDALPIIDTVINLVDVDALTAVFNYNNPTYTVELEDLKTGISGVLNGSLGLPTSHWDAIWTRAASDIARLQVTKARKNRNSGAASWWSLPSETVLSQARELADETTRSLQLDRLEKAVQEAVFAREDFWKGIDAALKYEELFIGIHIESAKRALEAAKETVNSLIAVYNANLAGYTYLLEQAKTEVEIDKITYDALIAKYLAIAQVYTATVDRYRGEIDLYKAKIDGYKVEKDLLITNLAEQVKYWNGVVDQDVKYKELIRGVNELEVKAYDSEVQGFVGIYNAANSLLDARIKAARYPAEYAMLEADLDKAKNETEISRYQAEQQAGVSRYNAELDFYQKKIEGYKVEKEIAIENLSEQVKYWGGVVDQDVKYKTLIKDVNELEVKAYDSEVQGFVGIYNAANSLLDARIKAAKYPAEYAALEADLDKAKNQIEVSKGELIVRSQEAKSRIDVAQAQWANSLYIENYGKVAEFNYAYAQAIATVSDVSLSAGTNYGLSYGIEASQNESLAWTHTVT